MNITKVDVFKFFMSTYLYDNLCLGPSSLEHVPDEYHEVAKLMGQWDIGPYPSNPNCVKFIHHVITSITYHFYLPLLETIYNPNIDNPTTEDIEKAFQKALDNLTDNISVGSEKMRSFSTLDKEGSQATFKAKENTSSKEGSQSSFKTKENVSLKSRVDSQKTSSLKKILPKGTPSTSTQPNSTSTRNNSISTVKSTETQGNDLVSNILDVFLSGQLRETIGCVRRWANLVLRCHYVSTYWGLEKWLEKNKPHSNSHTYNPYLPLFGHELIPYFLDWMNVVLTMILPCGLLKNSRFFVEGNPESVYFACIIPDFKRLHDRLQTHRSHYLTKNTPFGFSPTFTDDRVLPNFIERMYQYTGTWVRSHDTTPLWKVSEIVESLVRTQLMTPLTIASVMRDVYSCGVTNVYLTFCRAAVACITSTVGNRDKLASLVKYVREVAEMSRAGLIIAFSHTFNPDTKYETHDELHLIQSIAELVQNEKIEELIASYYISEKLKDAPLTVWSTNTVKVNILQFLCECAVSLAIHRPDRSLKYIGLLRFILIHLSSRSFT